MGDSNIFSGGLFMTLWLVAFFGYSFYEENADSLKLLGIDSGSGCVQPSTQTVQDGTYAPLSRPLYLYVTAKAMTRPEVQEFMRFAIPEVGLLISDVGFIGSPGQIYVEDQIRIEQIIAGQGTPDGPGINASPGA